jgi:ribosomal protein S18 acetylase RimI-like enzyme
MYPFGDINYPVNHKQLTLSKAMNLNFVIADYNNPLHAKHIIMLLDKYARDPMGGNQPLKSEVAATLTAKLASFPTAFSIIGYVQQAGESPEPVALANCFMGFSTFKAMPLINIHDCYVEESLRGMHIGQQLLAEVENIGKQRGCCKVTLEVLEGNQRAQAAYEKFGFQGYTLDDTSGIALCWEKSI